MGFEDQDVGDHGSCCWEEAIVSFCVRKGCFFLRGWCICGESKYDCMSEGMEFWCFQVQGMSNTKPAQLKHNENTNWQNK